jgi:hypothetical protein
MYGPGILSVKNPIVELIFDFVMDLGVDLLPGSSYFSELVKDETRKKFISLLKKFLILEHDCHPFIIGMSRSIRMKS